jgi:hypothetical protein
MENLWSGKSKENTGGFKEALMTSSRTRIFPSDKSRFSEVAEEITDSLFLPLSRGIRCPAISTCTLYYDTTSDDWSYTETSLGSSWIDSVLVDRTGGDLISISLIVDSSFCDCTEVRPIWFISNTSTTEIYFFGQVPFPRVSEIVDNTCKFVIETPINAAEEWGKYDAPGSDIGDEGMEFSVVALFQSNLEYKDTTFYSPSSPYYIETAVTKGSNAFIINTYVVWDLDIDTTEIPVNSKIQGYAVPWTGDCSTGSASGIPVYSEWESAFTEAKHTIGIGPLDPSTDYKVYLRENSKTGPDSYSWQTIGCYTTDKIGNNIIIWE